MKRKAPSIDNQAKRMCASVLDEWSYENKVILAPMVRVGTLPMRKLALKYGADMVYNQELIDHKVKKLVRKENPNGYIEYFIKDKVEFRTYPGEPVSFQLGSCDAARALLAAQNVANDVRAIDLNMGCPKPFSLKGGMGAALLETPEIMKDILTTLVRNLDLPVTCKIRLLEDREKTIQLVKLAESCGVKAIGVHARYTPDRSRNPCRIDLVQEVVKSVNIPVIFNGDIFYYEDIAEAKRITGASSVMIARGAQWNPSIFRPEGLLPLHTVMGDYLDCAVECGNFIQNTKYVLHKMLEGDDRLRKISPINRAFVQAKSHERFREAIELVKNYNLPPRRKYPHTSVFAVRGKEES